MADRGRAGPPALGRRGRASGRRAGTGRRRPADRTTDPPDRVSPLRRVARGGRVRRRGSSPVADRTDGDRPLVAVGRPAVRAAAGRCRRAGPEGRVDIPSGRRPPGTARLLRPDERRQGVGGVGPRPPGPGWTRCGALVARADVVIESSRPRALEQLGIDAAAAVASGPTVWVSITGHGRTGAARNRVGFGDDAAVAGGLVSWTSAAVGAGVDPCFCADAVADPCSGLVAAAAAVAALAAGGRWLVDVALSGVAARLAGPTLEVGDLDATAPRPPRSRGRAPALRARTRIECSAATRRAGGERARPARRRGGRAAGRRRGARGHRGRDPRSRSSTRRRGGDRRARRRAHPRAARPPPPPGRHRRGPGIGARGARRRDRREQAWPSRCGRPAST